MNPGNNWKLTYMQSRPSDREYLKYVTAQFSCIIVTSCIHFQWSNQLPTVHAIECLVNVWNIHLWLDIQTYRTSGHVRNTPAIAARNSIQKNRSFLHLSQHIEIIKGPIRFNWSNLLPSNASHEQYYSGRWEGQMPFPLKDTPLSF